MRRRKSQETMVALNRRVARLRKGINRTSFPDSKQKFFLTSTHVAQMAANQLVDEQLECDPDVKLHDGVLKAPGTQFGSGASSQRGLTKSWSSARRIYLILF